MPDSCLPACYWVLAGLTPARAGGDEESDVSRLGCAGTGRLSDGRVPGADSRHIGRRHCRGYGRRSAVARRVWHRADRCAAAAEEAGQSSCKYAVDSQGASTIFPAASGFRRSGRGALNAEVEDYFQRNLRELTAGDRSRKIVIYCLADCWMSWNAAKRAIEYGYRSVYWYPGGTDHWTAAGLPTEESQPVPMEGSPSQTN